MNQTFDEFLQERFIKINPQVIKDNFEVEFDRYLSDLEKDEYCELAEMYGQLQFLNGETSGINTARLAIREINI